MFVRNEILAACLSAVAICGGCTLPTSFSPSASTAPPSHPAGHPVTSSATFQNSFPGLPGFPSNTTTPAIDIVGANSPSTAAASTAPATQPLMNPWGAVPGVAGTATMSPGGQGLAHALLDSTDLLTEGFRLKPHVVHAVDPVRLDSRPANAAAVASDLHFHAGRVFEGKNSLASAAGHYRDALSRNPNDVPVLLSYARVQDRMGNYAEAEASYYRVLALNPLEASAHNGLGLCFARQAKWDVAMQAIQEAIRLQPENSLYRNNLALILLDVGRVDEAFGQLAAVHGEAGAYYNLGYLLFERQRHEEAQWHFARALELNPHLEQARQMLAEVTVPPSGASGAPPSYAQALPKPDMSRLPQSAGRFSPSSFGNPVR